MRFFATDLDGCRVDFAPMKYNWTCILLVMFFLVNSVASQQTGTTLSEAEKRSRRLMEVEVEVAKMVPRGMSIEAKEVSREGKSGRNPLVKYHLFVKGVPLDTLFEELQWPVNAEQPSAALQGISVGKDGILICAGRTDEQCGDSKKPDDPIEFIVKPYKGEPTRLVFIAPKFQIGIVIVADPIEAADQGCSLSAVRLTSKFELAFLSGAGYLPDSDVHLRISSATVNDSIAKSDRNGTFRFSVIPDPGKNDKGTVTVKIMEPKCSPELSYQWGTL
jgi:hypothetical protein